MRRAIPVEVEASEHDPAGVERVELEPLLVHEPVESDAAMLVLSRVVRGHLLVVVVLLCRPLVLYFARAFLL